MHSRTRLLLRLLRRVLPTSVQDGLVGDLEELHVERIRRTGAIRAGAWLLAQVLVAATRYGPGELASGLTGKGLVIRFNEMLRGSLRQLRKAPGFASVVISMVALGVGASVAVFALIDGVLLTPMPYPEPERVVSVSENNPNIQISAGWTSIPNFTDWQQGAASFEAMALFRGRSASLGTDGDPQYAYGAFVSEEFFDVFGVRPMLGRGFSGEETRTDGEAVVVLSYGMWESGFGADPEILGRPVLVDGRPHAVVGVMPRGFNAPGEWIGGDLQLSVWRPFSMDSDEARENRSYSAVARLSEGTTLTRARSELNAIHGQLRQAFPDANGEWTAQIFEWRELIVGRLQAPLFLLLGTMLLVLVIACSNVAALTTTRILARDRELATRVALGAPRGAIVSQVIAELGLLVGLGGAAGVLAASVALDTIKGLEPLQQLPRLEGVHVDGSVMFFALLATGLAGLLAGGVATGLTTRRDPSRGLRGSGVGPSAVGWRIRGALTVVQFVISFALLSGATLLAKSLQNMNRTELGFDAEGLTAMTVALSWDRVPSLEERTAFTSDMLSQLERIPGVASAAMINSLPLTGSRQITRVAVDGRTEEGREPAMAIRGVSAGYHSTMGIPLKQGRLLESGDIEARATALVSEGAARLHWPDQSPIGDRVRVGSSGPWLTVIGVVGDVLHSGARGEILPEVYIPYSLEELTSKSFLVRSTEDLATLQPALQTALRSVDSQQPIREVRSMSEWFALGLAPTRFQTLVIAGAALVATLLAAVGLFAAIGNLVRERGREIAIRMTLGAERRFVLGLVLRRASMLVIPGLGGGVLFALALGGLLEGFLFGVEPQSPRTLVFVAAGLLLTALAAVYLPAMRATSVDPARVLREE